MRPAPGSVVAGPALIAGAMMIATACGAPTAREVSPSGGALTYVVPADWVELERNASANGGEAVRFGERGADPDVFGPDPVLTLSWSGASDARSFRELRSFVTGGTTDPLAEGATLPDGLTVAGYEEISEPDVWGVRMVVLIDGTGALDHLGLVDRADQSLTVSEVACTQSCYVDHADEINAIQSSWTRGGR